MWFLWFAVGALAVGGGFLLSRSFGKHDAKPAWYDWLCSAAGILSLSRAAKALDRDAKLP